jgi:uncharacterized membrane protein YdfJ with MMPL/SSD domain
MSPLKRSNNIAARMGRWSASHWKTAVFGWLLLVVLAFAVGAKIGTKNTSDEDSIVGEAHHADQILRDGFPESHPNTEIVLIQGTRLKIGDPAFRATIKDVVGTVSRFDSVKNVQSPLSPVHADLISPDKHTAIVQWEMKGTYDQASDKIAAVTAATDAVATRHPAFYVGEAGAVSSGTALDKEFTKQLKQAGERSIPLTLIILVLVFGALIAAFLPLLLALTAVIGTMGLLALPSHLIPLDKNVSAVVLLIGLAVGVDYSLFYLKREREERAAGKGPRAALEAAAATSGRSVLISGFTVMIAMAGMLFTGDKGFMSFGVATMTVVAVAMLGSLTVLPALLSRLGDKVEKGRLPFLKRRERPDGENRFWSKVLGPAQKHPLVALIAAGGLLIGLSVPVLQLHTVQNGIETVSKSMPTVDTLQRWQKAFPGNVGPAAVAIKGDVESAPVRNAIEQLRTDALKSDQMHGPVDVVVNNARNVVRVDIPLNGNGVDSASIKGLQTLRNDIVPATLGEVPGIEYAVGGGPAESYDYNTTMKHAAPIVFGFVLGFAFLLLLVSFRSVVVAAKAIVLNLLSVGAAYGLMILAFQKGWASGILHFQSNGGIANWLPLFMFVILFGLSMDYHVFIISRIREAYDRGMKSEDAVEHGIKSTAGVVTSAAVVMVGVFAIFATLPILDMKEMGIGLAAAVLIDATIVRAVLLPATMKLLGDWNWYLPKWLEWLPRLEHEAPAPAPAPEAEPAPAQLAA